MTFLSKNMLIEVYFAINDAVFLEVQAGRPYSGTRPALRCYFPCLRAIKLVFKRDYLPLLPGELHAHQVNG